MKKYIKVKLVYEATHNWPECPFSEVAYLRDEHRHNFYITLIKEVSHNERAIEIILFKKSVEAFLASFNHKFENHSCETIADLLLAQFECAEVEVLEDNEVGGIALK